MTKPLGLIVEDDRKLAFIFAGALENADFITEIIRDGEIALQRLSEVVPSVIVLDLHLPHVSGREILQHIRSETRFAETKVILATADPALAESLNEEADLVMIKPISFPQLRDLSKRLLQSSTVEGE